MKKSMTNVAAIVMAIAATAGFTSCSTDEACPVDAILTADSHSSVVSVNRLDGIVEIPVNVSGSWTAEVRESPCGELPWVGVLQEKGEGPALLQVGYDYFSPALQQQERTTEIIIRGEGRTQTVRLRQYVGLKEGESVANYDETVFYDLWNNKGMGRGFNPLTGKPATGTVVNIAGLKSLAMGNAIYDGVLKQDIVADALEHVELVDPIDNDSVGLNAKAHLDVTYAMFQLGLDVQYNNKGLQVYNPKTYVTEQKVTFLKAHLDPTALRTVVKEDPEIQKDAKKLMSYGFQSQYKKIIDASYSGNELAFESEVNNMLDKFGPVIITDSEIGGSLTIAMQYDSLATSDLFKVDGKATAKFELGVLKIDAGVEAVYSRKGLDILENVQHSIVAEGGSQEAITRLTSLLNQWSPEPEAVNAAMTEWAKSIYSLAGNSVDGSVVTIDGKNGTKKDNTVLIGFDYMPIWCVFPLQVAVKMKPVITDYYQDKKSLIDLSHFGITGVEE